MQKRRHFTSVFLVLLLLSFFCLVVSRTAIGGKITGLFEIAISPFQLVSSVAYATSTQGTLSEAERLKRENTTLRIQVAKLQLQEKEIKALQDQFAVNTPASRQLLPARIVGLKAFLPGVTPSEQIIIDKGGADGLRVGSLIVSRDILVGRVSTLGEHLSVVDLVTKKSFSITAATAATGAVGIIKGKGANTMLLENVVLSDTLKEGDIVTTKGSMEADGRGAPPGLALGKVKSVDKKASALFQNAEVVSLLDPSRLMMVFVLR